VALLTSGIDTELALSLDRPERLAFLVIIGEQSGAGTFNWSTKKWDKPNA
jgi:hypothetical protein